MKKAAILCFVLLSISDLYGQKIKISVSPASSTLIFHQEVPFINSRPRFGAGIDADYLFASENKIRFGCGLGFQDNSVRYINSFGEMTTIGNLNAIITSVKAELFYYINDQFFFSLVPAFDYHFKNSKSELNDQTGLSLSFGLGNDIKLSESLLLSIEPRFTLFNVIPFKEKDVNYSLSTTGLNVGLVFGTKK